MMKNPETHEPTKTITAENQRAATVTVEMGAPQLVARLVPVASDAPRLVRSPLRALEREFAFTAVSMGNPHAVIFADGDAAALRELAKTYGPGLEKDSLFPRRTNVEFAAVRQSNGAPEIDLVVWERGCGITLACGTGACATTVAACLEGRTAPDQEIPVHLPGGTLFIRVASQHTGGGSAAYTGVSMRGPARIVFEAEIDPDQISKS